MEITQNELLFKKYLNSRNIRYFDYNNYISIELQNHIYGYPKPLINSDLKRIVNNIEKKLKRGKKNVL